MKINNKLLLLFLCASIVLLPLCANCGSIEIALSPIGSISASKALLTPKSCLDLFNNGQTEDNVYTIFLDGKTALNVSCDMTNGGWNIIAKRDHNDISPFSHAWNKYKNGFGSFDGSHWIGLQQMHAMTKRSKMQLRIDVSKGSAFDEYFIVYDNFVIGPEDDLYRLHVGNKLYGSLADSFSKHTGFQFSTSDKGNEKWKEYNCAEVHNAGWWFDSESECYNACLTCETKHTGNWYMEDDVYKFFPNFEIKIMPVRI